VLGSAAGVTVVDDYAHHPREVRATLAAARQRFPGRRLVAVFQPHTFSRTRALVDELAQALDAADQVLVTGIYAAREVDPGNVSSADIVSRMAHSAVYVPTLAAALAWLQQQAQPGDIVLTLGAGDITTLGPQLLRAAKKTEE